MGFDSQQAKGFIQELFDVSFSGFIVPRIIRILYIIGMIVAGLWSLFLVASMFATHWAAGLFGLVLAPVFFLLFITMARVYCEMIMVSFELLRNVEKIANHLTGGGTSLPRGGGPIDGRGVVHNPSAGPSPSYASPVPATPTPAQEAPVAPSSSAGAGWGVPKNNDGSTSGGGGGWA